MADEKEEINKEEMKQEMKDIEEEDFNMSDEEAEEAKKGGFNPFFSTKDMKEKKIYKFKVISEKMVVKKIEDKFQGEPTDRLIVTVENLEDSMVYDLAAQKNPNKDGNYSSLTQCLRRLFALSNGKVKDVMFTLIKTLYRHEKYGETSGFNLNVITVEPEHTE